MLSEGLRRGDLSRARFAGYERRLVRRYRHFRRFAVGFYDAPFRDLFLNPQARFGLYQAVLSILGGNWRPSLKTRLRISLFFALVGHPAARSRCWCRRCRSSSRPRGRVID